MDDLIYLNRVFLQGKVLSSPTLKDLSSRTKVTSFLLSTRESWTNEAGQSRERFNLIGVEVVGKDAETVAANAAPGSRVTLEGYIRTDEVKGVHVTKVRTLSIHIW